MLIVCPFFLGCSSNFAVLSYIILFIYIVAYVVPMNIQYIFFSPVLVKIVLPCNSMFYIHYLFTVKICGLLQTYPILLTKSET